MNRVAVALLIVFAAGPAQAASAQGNLVQQKWKAMDKCAKLAQTAFPDFTPEANAKRDAKLKECLEGQMAPPREPLAPAQ